MAVSNIPNFRGSRFLLNPTIEFTKESRLGLPFSVTKLISQIFIPPIAGSSKSENRRAISTAGKSDVRRIVLSDAVLWERSFLERLPIGEISVFLVPFVTQDKRDSNSTSPEAEERVLPAKTSCSFLKKRYNEVGIKNALASYKAVREQALYSVFLGQK